MEPHPLKLTIKLKSEKIAKKSSTPVRLSNMEGETTPPNSSNLLISPTTNSLEQVGLRSTGGGSGNHIAEDLENPSESSKYELVLYNPNNGNSAGETDTITGDRPPREHTSRLSPSIGAFTVQCANCFKWRLIPTKEKYEEIREHIIEKPFVCETGREWRPDISCDDPPDLTQDSSRLWAIDKPNIAQPPPGWQRLLKIRGEGSSKFADVYYVAPDGKRLRSMVEVRKYLDEHPQYIKEGVSLSQFSFQIPRPLRENYVRKRPPRAEPSNDAANQGMPGSLHPIEVLPIAWVSPDVGLDSQLSGPGLFMDNSESPGLTPETQSARKKKKTSSKSKQKINGDFVHNQNGVNVEDPHQF